MIFLRRLALPCLPLCCLILLTGCQKKSILTATQQRAEQQKALAGERQQLDQIPPPEKSKFLGVRSYDTWENPYITVQPDMVTLHVLLADVNPTAFGAGGMLRPIGARRQVIDISMGKLAEAMVAIPANSWPYGRVVGVEEAHSTPGKDEPAVRRNLETAVNLLNDLGITAFDVSEGNAR